MVQELCCSNKVYLRQQFKFHRLSYTQRGQINIRKKRKGRFSSVHFHLVRVRRLATVTNNVHATDHLANSEEANDLGGSDTGEGELLRAGIADRGEDSRGGGEGLEGSRVADEGLEVGLEGGQVARRNS